jgi:hypothetical protein
MKVVILSAFRNSLPYVFRYAAQMQDLGAMLNERRDTLHLILGYGDSIDGTELALKDACHWLDAKLIDVSHGGRHYGSNTHPQRFAQLAKVFNTLLSHVPDDVNDADIVGHVESDLVWEAPTLLQLIDDVQQVPAVAPLVLGGDSDQFYDLWAYARDGVHFTKSPPYHEALDGRDGLVQIDSAGSVLFVRGALAREARYSDGEAILGYCRDINHNGGSIWCDTSARVYHP